jgi:zinc/manganese transport system substrate-binding protein
VNRVVPGSKPGRRAVVVAGIVFAISTLTACGSGATPIGVSKPLTIVAAESFWGSIATQLLGSHGRVQSVVTDPNIDPHQYVGSTSDARAFAGADIVILNGAGYDDWGRRLLEANPSLTRKVLLVGGIAAARSGANPYLWYNPELVGRIADSLTQLYTVQDPADGKDFTSRRNALDQALQPYLVKVAEINQKYRSVPVGSTDSVFVYMAQALGLNLISPPELMQAIAQGADPPTRAVAQFQDQVAQKKIKMLVYNLQASSPVTTNLKTVATAQGIPLVGVTKTMPADSRSFQDWQLGQLQQIETALAQP